ncbi:MAG: thiamine-phosphate pyrophosphorylase [Candidatus Omnitrophota bacterium]
MIDANINRLKEAIRVCEDVSRFVIDDGSLSLKFKQLRHHIFLSCKKIAPIRILIQARDISKDVGKKSIIQETKRKDYREIFSANIQRAKESLRVLEEFSKVLRKQESERFKKIRYQIYNLEKEAIKKFQKHILF